jgi:hypothetical protein
MAGALLAVVVPAAAAPLKLEATDGRCTLSVNNGQIGANNHRCTKVTVSQDLRTGDVSVRYDMDSGLVVELSGAGMQVNDIWIMMGIGKVSWTNPGGAPVQDMLNAANSPRDQVIGQCAVSLQDQGRKIWEIYCQLNTAIGAMRADYKVPKIEDDKKAAE